MEGLGKIVRSSYKFFFHHIFLSDCTLTEIPYSRRRLNIEAYQSRTDVVWFKYSVYHAQLGELIELAVCRLVHVDCSIIG